MTPNKSNPTAVGMAPTAQHRTIRVEGMKGKNCISKVTTALDGVKDLSVDSVKVGIASLHAATPEQAEAACGAIKTAGFGARIAPALAKG